MSDELSAEIITLSHISKKFPGIIANQDVNLDFRRGEVHAILGENGAGKTTLMNIIAGLYRPDSGELRIDGQKVTLRNPRDASRFGIGMVHQHFTLVPSFSVTENILLGLKRPRFYLRAKNCEAAIRELADRHSIRIDPGRPVWQLSIGEQQKVEILKLLYRGARVLIMDEPTAVLTPQEADVLFLTLRNFVHEGRTVIFISHKLKETLRLADRISVLRKGVTTAIGLPAASQTADSLTALMVGMTLDNKTDKSPRPRGEKLLELKNLTAIGDRMEPALKGIGLEVYAGEVVGVAGVAGNGQRELVEVMTGMRSHKDGVLKFKGRDLGRLTPRQIMELGISSIPEDRRSVGAAQHLSVKDNSILTACNQSRFSRWGILKKNSIHEHAVALIKRMDISVASSETKAGLLSGGNLQKLILAREFSNKPTLLIAMHPTRGLDIGAASKTHELILALRNQGGSVLLIGEDLDELLLLSDRIVVIYNGKTVGEMLSVNADRAKIGLMMMGAGGHDDSTSHRA